MRNTFIDTVIESCKERDDIFIISGDAGYGVFDDFQKDYPERFRNFGVTEQNMTSHGAGLSMAGFKVYIYNIIPFVLYRNYEQVRNDICYQRLPVVLAGIGSGVTYAPGGMTHYSIEDIGLAQTLPNLRVFSPIDPVEARLAARYSLNADGPVYVRLPKRGEPNIHEQDEFDITVPRVLKEGEDIALLFHGSISEDVIAAYEELVKRNIHPRLISVSQLQPLNQEALLKALNGIKHVVSIEEHFENCGLGSILTKMYARIRPEWKLKVMGIPYGFIHDIKSQGGMRECFGICADNIIKTVEGILEEPNG